jgi:GT2 family glycosyltransferase
VAAFIGDVIVAKVSVLIPHHRGKQFLQPLFTSLFSMDMDPSQVVFVLVDNGSSDGSVELTQKKFPLVKICSLGENLGFAPALNRAVEQCDSEWVVFLNNDVRVDVDWLSNLLYAAKKYHAPCVSSLLLDWNGKQTQFGGGWINLFGKGFECSTIQSDHPYEIFFPCGCGMMIKRDLFSDCGGFDDDYFMLYEDVDLGWRLRVMGKPVYLIPDARVFHLGHASLEKIPYAKKALFYERNSLATIYKNVEDQNLPLLFSSALRETMARAKGLGGMGLPFRYSHDGLAVLEAVEDFLRLMPNWKEKRAAVQLKRQVSDRELFEKFFTKPDQLWAYKQAHYKRILHPNVKEKIEKAFSDASVLLK